ncbi:MAG TPA: preprotein translocase subunit SecG [Candidatus Cloacimonadota bacterium]|nr:preprotein translocase subunit SecG [Candidatus Cloacimonadota bacterium]HPK40335.1 preprotein translocase subunit SecG [Candidatus Cloacimonadota bacterium]
MWTLLIIIHIIICLALVLVVLMQTGKGGLDSNFAGIASNTFGAQSASDAIKNATKILFGVFIISCVLLATMNPGQSKGSNVQKELQKSTKTTEQPAQPQTQPQPVVPQ